MQVAPGIFASVQVNIRNRPRQKGCVSEYWDQPTAYQSGQDWFCYGLRRSQDNNTRKMKLPVELISRKQRRVPPHDVRNWEIEPITSNYKLRQSA